MRELLLVRYGEIFLKGQNRPVFMRALENGAVQIGRAHV